MSSPSSTPPRLLCVDDRVSSLDVRRALLKQIGYDVLIASDPPSALAILEKVSVDLVILDYSFPGQMSGEQLAHELRARKPGLPLIMLSGYPDLPTSVAESVDVLLLKGGAQPAELLNAIANLLPGGRLELHASVDQKLSSLQSRTKQVLDESRALLERSKGNISSEKS